METKLNVQGMSCGNCVRHVREALLGVAGVKSAEVDLESGLAVVDHESVEPQTLVDAVVEEGYDAQLID